MATAHIRLDPTVTVAPVSRRTFGGSRPQPDQRHHGLLRWMECVVRRRRTLPNTNRRQLAGRLAPAGGHLLR